MELCLIIDGYPKLYWNMIYFQNWYVNRPYPKVFQGHFMEHWFYETWHPKNIQTIFLDLHIVLKILLSSILTITWCGIVWCSIDVMFLYDRTDIKFLSEQIRKYIYIDEGRKYLIYEQDIESCCLVNKNWHTHTCYSILSIVV